MLASVLNIRTALPDESLGDEALENDAWIDGPIKVDYGSNLKYDLSLNLIVGDLTPDRLGANVYINFNCTFLDTCLISIGSRTLIGPNCSFYAATHPLDPFLRNGTQGPELGKPITVGEDCWFGGNCIVLPGVTIGRGVTIGAGSVVTKDIPAFSVVAGNPARVIRRIDPTHPDPLLQEGAEVLMADEADQL